MIEKDGASMLIFIDPAQIRVLQLFSCKNKSCLLTLILCSRWYLKQGYPGKLSEMEEIVYICTIQHKSHQPYVAMENLNVTSMPES